MERADSVCESTGGVRLLVLDDHALFCAGLVELFRAAAGVEQVAAATDPQHGHQLARQLMPGVILIDPWFIDAGPWEAARLAHACCPHAKLMFLDDSLCQLHLRAAVEAGVSGYWTKHDSFDEILAAVRRLAEGQTAFCPAARPYLTFTGAGLQWKPSADAGLLEPLTGRELEVLVYLARGLSVKQCAQRMCLASSTVDTHKSKLMRKLNVHKGVELAVLAARQGLLD